MHLDSAVTAMTFDAGGRRLVTGSHNGSELHVYNFGNRLLLARLIKAPHNDVLKRKDGIDHMLNQVSMSDEDELILDGDRTPILMKVSQQQLGHVGVAPHFSSSTNISNACIDNGSTISGKGNQTIDRKNPLELSGTLGASLPSLGSPSQVLQFGSPQRHGETKRSHLHSRTSIIPPPESPAVLGSVLHNL